MQAIARVNRVFRDKSGGLYRAAHERTPGIPLLPRM
jgi:hypothetical protein